MSYRELEIEDFQLAIKLLHSPAHNAKEEILKLVEKYNSSITKQPSLTSVESLPIKSSGIKRVANISDDSETDVDDDDNDSVATDSTGNACYVCKNSDQNNPNSDSLMKCHDCNTHCHRECHKPSISKVEYDDPRFIWYCTKCNKTVKKSSTSTKTSIKSSLTKTTSLASSASMPTIITSSSSAIAKRKPETLVRKAGLSFNTSSSSVPIGKPAQTNLSMSSVQQRIANRKAKK